MKNYLNPLSTKEAVNEMLKRGEIITYKKGVGYWFYVAGIVAIWLFIAYKLISMI